jgi:hypothetical protein
MVGVEDGQGSAEHYGDVPMIKFYITGKTADDACDVTKGLLGIDNSRVQPNENVTEGKPFFQMIMLP